MKSSLVSNFSAFCICTIMLYACGPKENISSNSVTDSIELPAEKMTYANKGVQDRPQKSPLDTIIASYPNGRKLHFLVLEYYDSLPDKPIKDFEVRDAQGGESIFRAVSERLSLGDEVDPINGKFDSLLVVPVYSISSQNPLSIDLDFIVDGGFRLGYLGDVTYPFYKESSKLKFLRYTFLNDNEWNVNSFLLFTPHGCNLPSTELLAQFNKIKNEKHFYTDEGSNLMKQAFNCFLNGTNPDYFIMLDGFRKAFGPTPDDPYTYYPYITYLDSFIVNLNFQ